MKSFQLHASGLAVLSKCGEQFRRRYIERDPVRTAPHIITGSAVDRSVSRNMQQKLEHGALLPVDEVKTIARDALSGLWSSEDVEIPHGETLAAVRDYSIDKAVRLAEVHYAALAPRLQPAAVQWSWVIDTPLPDLQIAGTADLVESNGVIRDLKTSRKTPNSDTVETSIQLTAYAMASQVIRGSLPHRLYLDYTVQTPKRQDLKWVILPTVRTLECVRSLWERIAQAHRVIESGLFTPAPADAWWCSKDYCGYFDSCKYARKPVTSKLIQLELEKERGTYK